jgi:hypothetical protein
MPINGLHCRVAAIALGAAAKHGFALGGGNALIAHGIIDRLTEDVDLFTVDRDRRPIMMDFGPVLDLEDVLGGKVCALASRAYERDFVDTAAALDRYSVDQLIAFAKRLDPGLTDQDFADAGRRLDQLSDREFAAIGRTVEDVARLRERFAAWPRSAPPRRADSDRI